MCPHPRSLSAHHDHPAMCGHGLTPRRSARWTQAAEETHRRTAAEGSGEGTHPLRREDDSMRTAGRRHCAVRLLQRLHLSGQLAAPGHTSSICRLSSNPLTVSKLHEWVQSK